MPLNYLIRIMKPCTRSLCTTCNTKLVDQVHVDYEAAVKALNSLQSNSEYLVKKVESKDMSRAEERATTVQQAEKYLLRADISLEALDTLSVIHIAGTKGKGSTCALCESILRHHRYRTGFYSSPHLMEVRERICINGVPICKKTFTSYFWEVYNKLYEKKSSDTDMPKYFTFLTIMALHVFITENVDVAVIEVGIGGEYDCTNIIRNTKIVGITSIGLDHTNILGSTIEKIAWHKAGIIKPGSRVFTVPQSPSVLEVLKERSAELNCSSFEVYEPVQNLSVLNRSYPKDIFNLNSNLALAISQAWLEHRNTLLDGAPSPALTVLDFEATTFGLLKCNWIGRYHIIRTDLNIFYIDGAHTEDSMKICKEWFLSKTLDSYRRKALIFNVTGDRNSENLLKLLIGCKFRRVLFVPNRPSLCDIPDMKNYNVAEDAQMIRCQNHYKIWKGRNPYTKFVKVLPSVTDAVNECRKDYDVLITGSLHLVGAALSVIGVTSPIDV